MNEQDIEALAAEYALGLLDAEDQLRADARLAADPDFAARVEAWRRHFMEIDLTATPAAPAAALWTRIESTTTRASASPRVEQAIHETARARAARTDWLSGLWDSLPAWRAFGLSATAAALALALGLGLLTRDIARTPVLVTVMMSDQNRPLALVNAFRDGRTELVPLESLAAPEGKSLQVWTLWDRARGPVSVGLLPAMRAVDLTVDNLPAAIPDQLFEVTLEPAGGSPTGRPTGPILMKGNASPTDTGA